MTRKGVLIGLLVAVLASTAWGFDAYFSDAAGNRLGDVREGQIVYIAVRDPDKGALGIDQFQADLVIFDIKTGAYIEHAGAWFRELGGIGTGLYFWVVAAGSPSRVGVRIGSRENFGVIPGGQTHIMGALSPAPTEVAWREGAWEYVDENILNGVTPPGVTTPVDTAFDAFPQHRQTARVSFEGMDSGGPVQPAKIAGRFENNNTLILIVSDDADDRNIDQDQIKITDVTAELSVTPARLDYGRLDNVIVRIEDWDENLNCDAVEYVPFFVIVNPGGFNPQTPSGINNFCALMLRGSAQTPATTVDWLQPIRWYNIYDEPVTVGVIASRWINYPDAWLDPAAGAVGGGEFGRALFFAPETAVNSGVFEVNFGTIEDLQAALGFRRFPPGTTIAFYYIDPNDFDDMDLSVVRVGDRPYSETFITTAEGRRVDEVRLGAGRDGLYVRVYDGDANVEACCPDQVVVHLCNPNNPGDSEYIVIDEISPNSGIFATMTGIPLLPVWDAVGGYQLVFDDWRFHATNEDSFFVRYNSVDYMEADLNRLGDGAPNDGVHFPPRIDEAAVRNQVWDVSFAKANVFDTQVFDGTTVRMRFLNERLEPVTTIPIGGSLHIEVTDLDQNEHPVMRELIFGGWNRDAETGEQGDATVARTTFGGVILQSAGEDSAPIWWVVTGTSDRMTPQGAVTAPSPTFLGATAGGTASLDDSITAIPETVKIFIWNAQRGTWERMDLRETAVGSGIFRSTTCVLVADARNPGDGNLGSRAGDTIFAFYQDPSNHSDNAIISIKVREGGAADVIIPVVPLSVAFDRARYAPGETGTITVRDGVYAGAPEILGTGVLVLTDAAGAVLKSWDRLPAVAGLPADDFRVSFVLPVGVLPGTITAVYTDPADPERTARATATVAPPVLTGVEAVRPVQEVFSVSTVFTVDAIPAGAVPDRFTVTIFDLTGRQVDMLTGTNTATLTWTGRNLGDGAYIFVATVWGPAGRVFGPFRGFVYIKR